MTQAGDPSQSVFFPLLLKVLNSDESDFEDAERVPILPKYYGNLISWTKGGAIGVLYVILALVLVSWNKELRPYKQI